MSVSLPFRSAAVRFALQHRIQLRIPQFTRAVINPLPNQAQPMDQLPHDFHERVAALWKCCDQPACDLAECPGLRVPACQWTRKSRQNRICLVFLNDCGKWKYCFCLDGRADHALTVDQVTKLKNIKDVRIKSIHVYEKKSKEEILWLFYERMKPLDVDVEKLLNFVSYLSNEAQLGLDIKTVAIFNTPEGSTLLRRLAKMTFSRINIWDYFPLYNPILENQLSSTNPKISLFHGAHDAHFFIDHLANGNIKRFHGLSCKLPAEVMDGIIYSFLENVENYEEAYFDIKAHFDEAVETLMEKKREEGLCIKGYKGYYFKVFNWKLRKHQFFCIRQEKTWWHVQVERF